jgi:DNA polymerase-3 subunit epsilon
VLRLIERFRPRGPAEPAWRGSAHTPLARLPAIAIDTETTGLEPRHDRVVSIAAVRLDGLEIEAEPALDILVDPGVPIPAHATHVHGIAARHVAGAPPPAEALVRLRRLIAGTIVIGHMIGFDLAILAAEARRHRIPWRMPVHLDTARLAAALNPRDRHLDLADLLRAHGLEPHGRRHCAADDARMAAELYVALARRLIGQGRGTFAAAVSLH